MTKTVGRQAVMVCFLALSITLATGCASRPCRVVCLGDSLTACGGEGGHYSDHLAAWLPDDEIINKGVGGDTLGKGRQRFQRDVMDLSPDVVIIELGANDFWKAKRPLPDLKADLEFMVRTAREADLEVVIASCFGDRDYDAENAVEFEPTRFTYAKGIAAFEKDIVVRYDAFYVPNMQVDIKPNGRAPYWDDRNHPNKQGNEFVARRIMAELEKALTRARRKSR